MTGLCAAPRHSDDDRPETEAHARLCRPCRLGLLWDLRRLPGLHADLAYLSPTGQGDGSGLPYSEAASECRSQIRRDLGFWARHVTGLRGGDAPPGPEIAGDSWSSHPVAAMAEWLWPQVTWCSFRDWAPEMAGAVGEDRMQAQALLNPFVRYHFKLPGADAICLYCPARLEATVYASPGDRRWSFVACPGCGMRWESQDWIRFGREIQERALQAAG